MESIELPLSVDYPLANVKISWNRELLESSHSFSLLLLGLGFVIIIIIIMIIKVCLIFGANQERILSAIKVNYYEIFLSRKKVK